MSSIILHALVNEMTNLSKKRELHFEASRERSLKQIAQAISDGMSHMNEELKGREGTMLSGAAGL